MPRFSQLFLVPTAFTAGLIALWPGEARAFCIYNETGLDMRAKISEHRHFLTQVYDVATNALGPNNYDSTVKRRGKSCCNWKEHGCNTHKGKRPSNLVKFRVTTRSGNKWVCTQWVKAGGWMTIKTHPKNNYQCSSYYDGPALVRLTAKKGMCVDISKKRNADGQDVHLWKCHGNWNQMWAHKGGRLVNEHGRCLRPKLKGDTGDPIVIRKCDNTSIYEWTVTDGQLRNRAKGHCLTAKGRGDAAKLILWHCRDKGTWSQGWTLG